MVDPLSSSPSAYQPTFSFGGVSSGLDIASIVSALLQPDTQALTNLQTAATAMTARKTAYGQLQTSLMDLLSKAQAFTMLNAASTRAATSSDQTKLTAAATTDAVPATYQVTVDALASATVARSTAAIGAAADLGQPLATAGLPGTPTAGTGTVYVDGRPVTVAVSDPTVDTLGTTLANLQSAIQSSLGDGTVAVTVGGGRINVTLSGNASQHTLLFGAPGDTTNVLGLLGLAGQNATVAAGGGAVVGTGNVGVAQLNAALDGARLTGLTSTTSGSLTINGVAIAYDTTKDSLGTVLARINASAAGVVASIDRANDRVVLTSRAAGAQPIVLADTSGTLLAALDLAPGTTNAQVIGQNAQLHVNGQLVTSATNQVTNAIDGVTLDLVSQTAAGSPVTLTVATDTTAVQKALSDFVASYNALADQLDKLTLNDPKQTKGPLATDFGVTDLALTLRGELFSPVAGLTGSVRSLADIGLSTGSVGSAVGSTTRLQLDGDKLGRALATDPASVASLLGSATGALSSVVGTLKSWTDYGSGFVASRTTNIDGELRTNSRQQTDQQDRIDQRRAALQTQFASMEALLSQLQQQQAQLGSQAAQFNK
ncbi:MAG TPA: flagellar filament capping protein FliD [Candidatus Limnocylindrales bacterium]